MARAAAGPKLKRSYADTDYKGGGYDGTPPKPGLYPAVLSGVKDHTTSDTALEWTFDITEGQYKGWRGFVYTNAEGAKWKEQQILVACGLMEPNGSIEMSHENMLKKAGPVRVRVINETYQEETKGKITSIIPPSDADADVDEDEEDEEDEDFKKPTSRAAARKKAAEPEPDEEDEEDEDEDEDADEGDEEFDAGALEDELAELTLGGLKARAKAEFGAKVADLKGLDEDGITDWILDKAEEAWEAEQEEADDEDADEDDEEEEAAPEPEPAKPARRARRGAAAAPAEEPAKAAPRARRGTTRKPPF